VKGIDVIFCFDPRRNDSGYWYQDYLNYKNQNDCKIIQRVGDIGTHGKPELTELVKSSTRLSDFIIFPSAWARDTINFHGDNHRVLFNAPNKGFYDFRVKKEISKEDRLKIVTHHWSTNPKKGFDYYSSLDRLVGNTDNVEFTFIGRLPEGFRFANSNYHEATGDEELLAKIISENDIYLTASREEAGANHVLEAMACGLPIVFHENGGSISEYCADYGLQYNDLPSMIQKISEIKENYLTFKNSVLNYNDTIDGVIKQYVGIICNIK
jgi:glycosyltransferase involved in cell wall biosynthesis